MRREPPAWWYGEPGPLPILLSPLTALYSAGLRFRWALTTPRRASIPVLCVGNLTAGGAGKTPLAMAAARVLIAQGERPAFLARGYGGREQGPLTVDPDMHDAAAVGDEPLLLARLAPTVVAADKVAGAAHAAGLGASVIVMDDGFQNPSLAKDLAMLVVDANVGAGNGWTMPSGPLRAPLDYQLDRADAAVVAGRGHAGDDIARAMRDRLRRALRGELLPTIDTGWLQGQRVVAFAGIGRPEKFFGLLEELGARIVEAIGFPDHHAFDNADAERLLAAAQKAQAILITTEKDHVRIAPNTSALADLHKSASVLPVAFRPDDPTAFADLVASVMTKRKS